MVDVLSGSMVISTTEVPGYGQVKYAQDIYDELIKLTVAELKERLLNHTGRVWPAGTSVFRKTHWAAMVARRETAKAVVVEKSIKDVRRNLKKAQCGCGQYKPQLENGTMQRHTRFNNQGDQWQGKSIRVRCEWSGLFPPAIEEMRLDTNRRDAQNQVASGIRLTEVAYTYRYFQVPDTRGRKQQPSGSRRNRREGTKNAHRAKYGKRFQGVAA